MEIATGAAPDAIVIDAQHGLWDRQGLEHAVGLFSASRAGAGARRETQRDCDRRGARCRRRRHAVVPLIDTDTEAAAAVSAALLPAAWGALEAAACARSRMISRAIMLLANDRTVVGVMIETQRGVRNASAIAHTKGIDFVLIGTGDLAISLGGFPNVDARHEEACKTVFDARLQDRAACRAASSRCRRRPPPSGAPRATRSSRSRTTSTWCRAASEPARMTKFHPPPPPPPDTMAVARRP